MPWRKHAPERIPLFQGFKPEQLREALDAGLPRRLPPDALVTYQDEPAKHLYVLLTGRARLFFDMQDGKKIMLHWLRPGESFGAAAWVPEALYIASVETCRTSLALEYPHHVLYALASRFPLMCYNQISIDLKSVAYLINHVALTSQPARQRLATVLTKMSRSLGELVREHGQEFLELDVTNEELAACAQITAETTARLMSEWQRTGAIFRRRGKVVVRSDTDIN